MTHRGEVVKKVVKDLGVNLSVLSQALGISRATLYRYLEQPDISWKHIYDIGQAIRYDFKKDFPDMPFSELEMNVLLAREKELEPYGETVYDLRIQLKECREKYLNLLEKYSQLLEKLS